MERFVPKTHPLDRAIEPDDPMELTAHAVAGDPEEMLDSLLQEYAWLGLHPGELLRLFQSPMYPVLNQLFEHFGQTAIERRIFDLMGENALVRFTEEIDDSVDDEERTPELIEIGLCDSMRSRAEA